MKRSNWLLVLLLAATLTNYPNPFTPGANSVTTIECSAEATTNAFLYIYDMGANLLARKVFNLTANTAVQTTWDGYTDSNQRVGNGIYLYQIISTDNQRIGKGKIWVIN